MIRNWNWKGLLFLLLSSIQCAFGDEVLEALELEGGALQQQTCIVQDYGAVGDGKTDDRLAIQAAIDECSKIPDGGIVTLEAGKKYLTGALHLVSKVTLRISEKSVLMASTERSDYPDLRQDWYLILIDKATRVAIEGPGKIVGQASKWTETGWGGTGFSSRADESCLDDDCRPSLIGVRDSSQVTVDGVELRDFANTGLLIARSDAVAVMSVQIESDLGFTGTRGIVVDGSKRVFIGQSSIVSCGSCITAMASTGAKALESLLIDNVVLESRAAAFQIGPQVKAEVKTIVIQNAEVESSKRGISVQLHDSGDMHDIWFTNVTVSAQHMEGAEHGAAECVHVSVKPRLASSSVGKLTNAWFGNVSCSSEGGYVLSGDADSTIEGLTVRDAILEMTRSTGIEARFRDYRPSQTGLVNATQVPVIFLEYANHVVLSGIKVVMDTPSRREWGDLLEMTPHTVHALQISDLQMHDEAAHPSNAFSTPMKKMSQLGEFFRHSVQEWASALNKKGFISLQENAAFGVSGRRAASSGSPIVMGLLVIVLIVILLRYCCIPAFRKSSRRLPA